MQHSAELATATTASALDPPQLSALARAVEGFSRQQLHWASGYLAGLGAGAAVAPVAADSPFLTILYATAGGNARGVAEALAAETEQRGVRARLLSVDQYRARELARERLLAVVISTQGEGEPPESARELFRYLGRAKPGALDGLRYAVFGLGDSSYVCFNQAARDLDQHLADLGAERFAARVDADIEYAVPAADWRSVVVGEAGRELPAESSAVIPLQPHVAQAARFDRDHPYLAPVVDTRPITTDDAVGEVHHLVLEVDPDTVRYQPGDALGLWFRNDPVLVGEVLKRSGLDGAQRVHIGDRPLSLGEALRDHLELTQLHPSVVSGWAELSDGESLGALRGRHKELLAFAADRQVIDLLAQHPVDIDGQALVEVLKPLQPRLYSLASSPLISPDELHLTVATLKFTAHGREHLGGASGYLNRRVAPGDEQRVYVVENTHFRPPEDGETPLVMIGAGTGIAPFRAFLQHREAQGASGRNWLVFGNRHFRRDFLYQTDWIAHRDAGRLDRISLAFSRDAAERVYVQDRLREEGKELYRWLEQGARIYVCGAVAMERSVREALRGILASHGGLSDERALAYIEDLQVQGRYLKDVY